METIQKNKVKRIGYTLDDVAISLSLSRPTVYKLVSIKDFPKVRIGRKYVIPVRDLEDWLTQHLGDAFFSNIEEDE